MKDIKAIELLMDFARINMKDAEDNKNSYGLLMYYQGKIVGFEYAYGLMNGFDRTNIWKKEASNDEFIQMKKRCDELIDKCDRVDDGLTSSDINGGGESL